MRKILLFAALLCIGAGGTDAATRDVNSVNRNSDVPETTSDNNVTNARVTSRRQSTTTTARPTGTTATSRTTARTTANRASATDAARKTTSRSATSATRTIARSATRNTTNIIARSATKTPNTRNTLSRTAVRPARAASGNAVVGAVISNASETFGTAYNTCRDAYFTCMDQFCAHQNESYRRCVCSSRFSEIQSLEQALGQSTDQLQDFVDLNLSVIPKTGDEVKAMLSASEGEYTQSYAKDTSESAQKLAGISDVLDKAKSQSLSTSGTLDIAGNINQIWATTDLASGANIANLTGESLYNAVHTQCSALIADMCPDAATLSMVVSAYGMYIENDCNVLSTALNAKRDDANSAIRETHREMNTARLENYNAHNSTAINDCIAQVRTDITVDTACGADYIHCNDVTGRYLNSLTGEPIYTAIFFQLEKQVSLDGDILTNPTNRILVDNLNRKRIFAQRGLETCRDIADDVWDEFMRQAITEIYQNQLNAVRTVKNECLDTVNQCYDEKNKTLRDFSNIDEQLLLGQHMELSEELCRTKLDTCANLYGGGESGLELMVNSMKNITDQTIAVGCRDALNAYLADTCAVSNNDSRHAYPYGCRMYIPGEQKYALMPECNKERKLTYTFENFTNTSQYTCAPADFSNWDPNERKFYKYTQCTNGYRFFNWNDVNQDYEYDTEQDKQGYIPKAGNMCFQCVNKDAESADECVPKCGTEYPGSLYQNVVRYAMNACVRPSDLEQANYVLPTVILQDVNVVMDTVRYDMAAQLSAECELYGGLWVDTVDPIRQGNCGLTSFYQDTGASKKWGICMDTTKSECTE